MRVYNRDAQSPDAYKRTSRIAANVIFSPFSRVDAGLGYIHGSRTNKDDQSAEANQVQFVMLVRF